jgi:D-alanine-D-alanine ligase
MRLGLVYDLRADYAGMGLAEEQLAELDSPETIDALATTLVSLGHAVDRIGNIRALVGRLARGDRWDLIFNIAEGLHGRSREAQVPALLEAYAIPCAFSDPLVMAATLDKAVAKRIVRDAGVPTAPFAVVEEPTQAGSVDLPLPLFVKPIAEGTGKGVTPHNKVTDRAALEPVCAELIRRHDQPVLVETFLPGRESTVGILGTGAGAQALGVLEIELLTGAEPEVYSYVNKEKSEELVRYHLASGAGADAAADVALAAYRALGVRDAGRVDIRCDGLGQPMFLEVNPLPGLHPTHSDLPILASAVGMSFQSLIRAIVEAAAARYGLVPAPAVLQAAE